VPSTRENLLDSSLRRVKITKFPDHSTDEVEKSLPEVPRSPQSKPSLQLGSISHPSNSFQPLLSIVEVVDGLLIDRTKNKLP